MKEDNTILINNLPEDIIKLIISEFIIPEIILIELNEILNLKESKKLEHKKLFWYLKNFVLPNDIVIKNLMINNNIFNKIFKQHFIENKKIFTLIEDPIESMALSWLMYLHH